MNVIIYRSNKQMEEVSVDAETKVKDLLEKVAGGNGADLHAYAWEGEEALQQKDEIKGHKALVIHGCKKVQVEIVYPGAPAFSHFFPPAMPIKNIRKEAIKKLSIDEQTSNKLELYENQQQDAKLNSNYPLGYYSDSTSCTARFYLLDSNAFQGC